MLIYLLIFFFLLFAKEPMGSVHSVNLVPFRTIMLYLRYDWIRRQPFALFNVIGNIVLFMPMGIYLGLFSDQKSIWVNTLRIFCFSVAIEGMQLIMSVGIADVDDVLLNTLGGFLGAVMYRILERIFQEKVPQVIAILAPIGAAVIAVVVFLINR